MEAILLVCGAGGPQLKRNPLGSHTMHRWLQRIFHPSFRALYWSTRLYSVFFFALGAILLFGGARGLVTYASGVRTAWGTPLASGAGLVAGILSVWTGIHVLRGN